MITDISKVVLTAESRAQSMDLMDAAKDEYYPIQMCLGLNKRNQDTSLRLDYMGWNYWPNKYWTIPI